MGEFSLTHLLIIAVIAIVFFGPKRLPALGQSLGESIRGFKKAMSDQHDNVPGEKQRRETIVSADGEPSQTASQATKAKDTTNS